MEGRRLIIAGLVQGVGYRYSMQIEAQRRGACGWVRNRRDGTVEAQIHGDPETIAALLLWARSGPPNARVDHVAIESVEGEFEGFELLPTS